MAEPNHLITILTFSLSLLPLLSEHRLVASTCIFNRWLFRVNITLSPPTMQIDSNAYRYKEVLDYRHLFPSCGVKSACAEQCVSVVYFNAFNVYQTYELVYILQVYAEPVGYWKNKYNIFDFVILVISVCQTILSAHDFGPTGLTVLKFAKGVYCYS